MSTLASGCTAKHTSTAVASMRRPRNACRSNGLGSSMTSAIERFRSRSCSSSLRAASSRQKNTHCASTRRLLRSEGCSSVACTSTPKPLLGEPRRDVAGPGEGALLHFEARARERVRCRLVWQVGVKIAIGEGEGELLIFCPDGGAGISTRGRREHDS